MKVCPECQLGNGDQSEQCSACGAPLAGSLRPTDLRRLSPVEASAIYQPERQIIGREPSCEIRIDSPGVSQRHASLTRSSLGVLIADLGSSRGTFVNKQPITQPTALIEGDLVEIGMTKLLFEAGVLVRFDEAGHARLDVFNLGVTVQHAGGPLALLNDVSMQVRPREFMALVGGSGAGKSTLLRTLCGLQSCTTGAVYLNGVDLHRNRSVFADAIGYVPQDDIIHLELTVREALEYACRLRLPPDTTAEERAARVRSVIVELGLVQHAEKQIARLSGGQRKRVSIGVELLSEPSLLFLDEPTSGLDPGLERQMMLLLRNLADAGRTIILVTHATQNIALCDSVVYLATGGHLAYRGDPGAVLNYFGVSDFAQVYELVDGAKLTPSAWAERFHSSREGEAGHAEQERMRRLLHKNRKDGTFQRQPRRSGSQLGPLVSRYLRVVSRDRRNLAILMLQAPIIGLLLSLVNRPDVLDPAAAVTGDVLGVGRFVAPRILAFLLAVAMVWLGATNGAREVVKERAIFARERMVGLSVWSYLGSKAIVLLGLAAVQVVLLVIFTAWRIRFGHAGFQGFAQLCFVLLLVGLCATASGLLVSCLASSVDQAGSLIPILLLPQLFLCGALLPLPEDLAPVSKLTICRWGYEGVGRALGLVEFYDEALDEDRERSAADPVQGAFRQRFIEGFRNAATLVGRGAPSTSAGVLLAISGLMLVGCWRALSGTGPPRA